MKNRTTQVNQSITRRGVIAILFALLVPILIVVLGFSIDYAHMQRTRNEVRVISDLASKAAADTLARTGGDIDLARDAAKAVAAANTVAGQPMALEDNQIIFGRSDEQANGSWTFTPATNPPFNAVQVEAARDATSTDGPIPLFFGQFYGNPDFETFQTSTASFRDLEVCLVLDRSGSMKDRVEAEEIDSATRAARNCQVPAPFSRWRSLDDAVELFLDELDATPVNERIAMVTFSSVDSDDCSGTFVGTDSTLNAPLTTNTGNIRTAMDVMNTSIWNGGTNVEAGLHLGRTHLETTGQIANNRVIIVLTDGKFNRGLHPQDEAALAQAAGITVHTITFSEEANQADMILTAAAGGGEHYHAPDQETLEQVFRRLAGSFAILTD
jgi:Flp pilus assembly protein TadG